VMSGTPSVNRAGIQLRERTQAMRTGRYARGEC
jgi:hypothetical protein